jgi:hypothetical protein
MEGKFYKKSGYTAYTLGAPGAKSKRTIAEDRAEALALIAAHPKDKSVVIHANGLTAANTIGKRKDVKIHYDVRTTDNDAPFAVIIDALHAGGVKKCEVRLVNHLINTGRKGGGPKSVQVRLAAKLKVIAYAAFVAGNDVDGIKLDKRAKAAASLTDEVATAELAKL